MGLSWCSWEECIGTFDEEFRIEYDGSDYYADLYSDGTWDNDDQSGGTWTWTDTGKAVWPHPVEVLGSGITNEFGNVWFSGTFDFDSIPWSIDINNPGAKIWLVLTSDIIGNEVDGFYLSGWNPTEYLFEYNVLP